MQEESAGAVWGASSPWVGAVVVEGTGITRDSSEFKPSPPDRDSNTGKTQQGGNGEAPSAAQTPPATSRGNLAAH